MLTGMQSSFHILRSGVKDQEKWFCRMVIENRFMILMRKKSYSSMGSSICSYVANKMSVI